MYKTTYTYVHTYTSVHTYINRHEQDEEIVDLPTASPGFPITPHTNKGMHNLTLF